MVAPLLAGFLQGVVAQVDLRGALWCHGGGRASHRAVVRDGLGEKERVSEIESERRI